MALPVEREDLIDESDETGIDDDFGASAAIVPATGVSGRALFFVLSIMSVLA